MVSPSIKTFPTKNLTSLIHKQTDNRPFLGMGVSPNRTIRQHHFPFPGDHLQGGNPPRKRSLSFFTNVTFEIPRQRDNPFVHLFPPIPLLNGQDSHVQWPNGSAGIS